MKAAPQKTNLTLRDGQQSTLAVDDWTLDTAKVTNILCATQKAGFDSAEIAGGQSFQTAIGNGYNPFTITDAVSNALNQQQHCENSAQLDLQMLFRGANALGFRHYDKDVVEATLAEFIKNGITKIRFFDALNDIDNLFLPDSIQEKKGVILQGAICFGHYRQAPERYTDEYFVNYAQQLISKGFTHIAIKDMSGQMTAKRMSSLLPALQDLLTPLGIPIELHIHSTNPVTSLAAAKKAIELGIDSIETVEGPLSGGSAHHSLSDIAPSLINDQQGYDELIQKSLKIWKHVPRKDLEIDPKLKDLLCDAGVPGGAMPFVIRDLKTQMPTISAKQQEIRGSAPLDFSGLLELFINELKQVCQDAAYPLLVTPTADICCKQAIANLAFGNNPYSGNIEDRYLTANGDTGADPRFTKLILGHYGEFKSYNTGHATFAPDERVLQFFEAHNPLGITRATEHPSLKQPVGDMAASRAAAWTLMKTLGSPALSFANFDQLTLMYALRPSSAPGVDPIANAVKAYEKRTHTSRINGTGMTFPGYRHIMQPVVSHLGALYAAQPQRSQADIMNTQLEELGRNLYRRLFRTYATLPLNQEVTRVRNNLTNLISSDHSDQTLMQAVAYVGESFKNLDFHPKSEGEAAYEEARERFKQLTISELFGALALTHSLVNSVDKHGTDPNSPALRAITLDDINKFSQKHTPTNPWEARLQRAIQTRHFQIETDLQNRIKEWRMS